MYIYVEWKDSFQVTKFLESDSDDQISLLCNHTKPAICIWGAMYQAQHKKKRNMIQVTSDSPMQLHNIKEKHSRKSLSIPPPGSNLPLPIYPGSPHKVKKTTTSRRLAYLLLEYSNMGVYSIPSKELWGQYICRYEANMGSLKQTWGPLFVGKYSQI